MTILRDEQWSALTKALRENGADDPKSIVDAFIDLYSVYDDALLVWLAKLYDKKYGGFYYSNSAKNNDKLTLWNTEFDLLPDIESTYQAICLLMNSKVFDKESELPAELREQIKEFICSRQSAANGFFYHPQWSKEMVDKKHSRRGRDLRWAQRLAKRFGFELPYVTADKRLVKIVEDSDSTAVTEMPEYLLSRKAFTKYLSSFDWDKSAYSAGNTLAAQTPLIKGAGLDDVAIEFLNGIQHFDTGLWGDSKGYGAINAYLKITAFYGELGKEIPRASRAALSVLECATTEETPGSTCCQYNVWYSLRNIINSLKAFDGGAEGESAKDVIRLVVNNAVPAIKATKEKILLFRKEDHSFSMGIDKTSSTSQGMPVAFEGENEGDINATLICTSGIVENMFASMDIASPFMPPLFSDKADKVFLDALNYR